MADRGSASITIGGDLSAALLLDFVRIINDEGLSTDWDGSDLSVSDLPGDGPLRLMAHEVAWGRFDGLEAFCVANRLPFARWSGACPGQWDAERVVFTGTGEPQSYEADEIDNIVISREVVDLFGIWEAILDHFEAADFPVPPLRVVG
jgi:hypothetical protein